MLGTVWAVLFLVQSVCHGIDRAVVLVVVVGAVCCM